MVSFKESLMTLYIFDAVPLLFVSKDDIRECVMLLTKLRMQKTD